MENEGTVKTESPIEGAIVTAQEMCRTLNADVMNLEVSLKPVLRESPPSKEIEKTAEDGGSQVSTCIRLIAKEIDKLHTRLQSILERLEV